MSEELETGNAVSPRSEWIKFVILAAIMLGAVLVVALLRPYIFNHVVPAVMGEGMAQPAKDENELHMPVITDSPREEESAEEGSAEMAAPEDSAAPEAYPAPETEEPVQETVDEAENAETETAVSTLDHIVQPNENLTTIARQYNTTIQAILDANDIPNPNRIDAGTILHIPQP